MMMNGEKNALINANKMKFLYYCLRYNYISVF